VTLQDQLLALLKGGAGTVQVTFRRPITPAKGEPMWSVQAIGQKCKFPPGFYVEAPTLQGVLGQLPKPTTAG